MSKINAETLEESIAALLKYSLETKKRGFTESIELQVALKNYDPAKDKRFSGSIALPIAPRPGYKVCLIGNAQHIDAAKKIGLPAMSTEDLGKLNRNKKLVKKLAASYDAFLASADLIKKIPRLLGPGLNKAGKFPSAVGNNEDLAAKVKDLAKSVKFALKSKKTLCVGVAVANVTMSAEEILININLSVNFLVGLLKKGWMNIKRLYIKSTMGPSFQIFGL